MKDKLSTRKVLEELNYPVRYKRFSKIFKRIKKTDRRFFIKLLKVICMDIKNSELIYYATFSQMNLNQYGLMLLMDNRIILVHSKVKSKTILKNEYYYSDFEEVDFIEGSEDEFGELVFKVQRETLSDRNYKIRLIKNKDLPRITQFIREKISEQR